MATLDDMDMDRKLTIYDKGFDPQESSFGDREYVTRSGMVSSPPVPSQEPLRIECEHFIDCVRDRGRPPAPTATTAPGWSGCSRRSRPRSTPAARRSRWASPPSAPSYFVASM